MRSMEVEVSREESQASVVWLQETTDHKESTTPLQELATIVKLTIKCPKDRQVLEEAA